MTSSRINAGRPKQGGMRVQGTRARTRTETVLRAELLEGRRVCAAVPATPSESVRFPPVAAWASNAHAEQCPQVSGQTIDGTRGHSSFVLLAANPASATPVTAPGAPTHLKATVTNGHVTLTWAAPENDGGEPVTDYVIEFGKAEIVCIGREVPIDPVIKQRLQELIKNRTRTAANETWRLHIPSTVVACEIHDATVYRVLKDDISPSTSVTVSGLKPGETYNFRVAATNSAGRSVSAYCSITIPPLPTPATGDPHGGPAAAVAAMASVTATGHQADGRKQANPVVAPRLSASGSSPSPAVGRSPTIAIGSRLLSQRH